MASPRQSVGRHIIGPTCTFDLTLANGEYLYVRAVMALESVKRQEANAKQRKQPAKTAEFSLVKVKNSRGGDATWGWIASLSVRPTVTLLEQAIMLRAMDSLGYANCYNV